MIGVIKELLLLGVAVEGRHEALSLQNLLGFGIAVCGVALYHRVRQKAAIEDAALAELRAADALLSEVELEGVMAGDFAPLPKLDDALLD